MLEEEIFKMLLDWPVCYQHLCKKPKFRMFGLGTMRVECHRLFHTACIQKENFTAANLVPANCLTDKCTSNQNLRSSHLENIFLDFLPMAKDEADEYKYKVSRPPFIIVRNTLLFHKTFNNTWLILGCESEKIKFRNVVFKENLIGRL